MSREMVDSGVEWIGRIPKKWLLKPLRACVTEINEKNNPIKFSNVLSLTNTLGVVPYEEKGNHGNISKEDLSQYKLAYKSTIIINSMNLKIGSVGLSNYDGCVSPVYYVLSNKKNADINFINYLFKSDFQKYLGKYGKGILEIREKISMYDVLHSYIPFPSLNEQFKISNYLDEKCFKIDNIIEGNKKEIELLEEYKKSLIEKIMLYNGKEKIVTNNIFVPYKDKKSKITKVKYMYNVTLGKMVENKQVTNEYTYENYLCSLNVKWTGIDISSVKKMWFSPKEKLIYLLKKGDIVVTEGGSVGETAIYNGECAPCYIQNAVHKVVGMNYNENKYFYYWMFFISLSFYLDVICNKATIAHYTKEKLLETPIIFRNLEEQRKIVKYLDNACSKLNKIVEYRKQIIEKLEEYKKSLIYEVITGKKEV